MFYAADEGIDSSFMVAGFHVSFGRRWQCWKVSEGTFGRDVSDAPRRKLPKR